MKGPMASMAAWLAWQSWNCQHNGSTTQQIPILKRLEATRLWLGARFGLICR